MFGSISWGEFALYTLLLAAMYYLVIGWKFYRKEILRLFQFRQKDVPVIANRLEEDLKVLIRKAAMNKSTHPELMYSLHQRIKQYDGELTNEKREMINQLILDELQINGEHGIGKEELDQLWR